MSSGKILRKGFVIFLLLLIERLDKRLSSYIQKALAVVNGDLTETDSTEEIERKVKAAAAGVDGDPLVIEMQSYLAVLGFPLGNFGPNKNGVDGKFGETSKEALKTIQRILQLEVNGELSNSIVDLLEEKVYSGKSYRELAKEAYQNGVNFDISKAISKAGFVNAIFYYAVIDESNSKVPAGVTTSQAILESGYGKYVPVDLNSGKYSYNLFGIKGTGPAGSVSSWTKEENTQGIWEPKVARFKAYGSFEESIKGHSQFFYDNLKRYGAAFQTSNSADFAREIARAGYATDSKYADKLIFLMNHWGIA